MAFVFRFCVDFIPFLFFVFAVFSLLCCRAGALMLDVPLIFSPVQQTTYTTQHYSTGLATAYIILCIFQARHVN